MGFKSKTKKAGSAAALVGLGTVYVVGAAVAIPVAAALVVTALAVDIACTPLRIIFGGRPIVVQAASKVKK